MRRILVVGNSGSGKSTLAKSLCSTNDFAHYDLDPIAWLPTTPPIRTPIVDSAKLIEKFISEHSNWVIEGCYSDLLEIAVPHATELIFLNVPVEDCVSNARSRAWEPHKYSSKELQDANLPMLIDWIVEYPNRKNDTCSLSAHESLYSSFSGIKSIRTANA
jgi:adenylate kinase family enzyme